ncbi:LPD38 domain-containing protein [Gallibacterium sp. AGMB14963]|uniref:LPD38 domain-containing protein n=1 Tax=Gallibacterium faecale TaxID=3019086 RepID=UPI0022F15DF0|nr:LPD38 domain-containing protein [Gallibacterium sp. AGMB14963]MDA3978596.1 hypothetical protein [Gallibacterium sp. AGMB14963]
MFYLTNERYKEMTQRAYGKKDDEVSPLSYMNSDEISTYTTPQQKEQQGVLADTVDAFQMGVGRGASDLSRLVAIGANKLGFDSVESWFNKAADASAKYADSQMNEMSDEMKVALNQDVTEDPSALTNIRWWAGNLGAVLGSELDTVLVTAATLGMGSAAYAGAKTAAKQGVKYVMKKELAEKVGQVAFNEAVKRGASKQLARAAGLTAVQSAMMAGSRANQTREDMLRLSDEELANNDKFIQEYSAISNSEDGQLMTGNERFEVAKNNFIAKASRDAAFNPASVLSDLATNAISGLGGGFMGFGKAAKTLKGGLLKGAMIEGGTEAIQGVTDQMAVNTAAKQYYDQNRDITEGMASNAIQGAILGAAFGAPTGALDVYSNRRALNNAKKQLLEFKSTGNETVDQSLRSYVDMINQQANDLDDLISQSRFNAHYAMAQREARAANIMADLNQSTNQPDLSQSQTQDAVNTFTQNHTPIQTSAITENQLGGVDEVDIGNGNYQPISYAVVDAANLMPAQNKADNQFRDRNRVASLSQINEIARNLDPRKLSASPTMDIGAPLLAQDGSTIIAGNGRTMALRQAYQQGLANNYRQYLLDNADKFGLSPEQISQVANPVLVRRLNVPVDIAQAAIRSNEQGGMRMSNLEQAKVDAQRLPSMDNFYIGDNGNLNNPNNQNFIRQFIQNQPENLRNELLDSAGNLSQTGVQRVRNAILYRAYGDTETLSRAVESTDPGARNIITALTRVAPTVAQAKQDVESGRLNNEVDLSSDIVAAVEKYNQLKQQDLNIDEYLKQQDFVSDITPEAKEILQIFNENARSSKRIADILNNYYQAAQKQGNTSQTNMFGEVMFDREGTLVQAKNVQDLSIEQFDNDNANKFSRSPIKSVEANIKRGREAMNKAIVEKNSVHRAMYNHQLDGWIDFEWGDVGRLLPSGKTKGAMGIAHIIESRMRKDNMSYQDAAYMLTDRVIDTLAKGQTSKIYESGNVKSVFVEHNGNRATLIKRAGSNSWLMNAFELNPDEQRGSNDPDLPTHNLPTRQRQAMGAGFDETIINNNDEINNDDIRYSKNNNDDAYLELAKRYEQGDKSIESQLRELVDEAARNKGFGKPDYRMSHDAPNRYDDISRSIDDLSELYPADLYSPQGYRYYGSGFDNMDKEAWQILRRVKGNPEAEVTIYRAYPKGTGGTITNGDWVTIVRDYAIEHGEGPLQGDYEIVSKKVKAKDVFTNADSLLEQGYDNGLSEVVNHKKKIKLDELITYDDNGEIIPLSKRFNARKNDVRYSKSNSNAIKSYDKTHLQTLLSNILKPEQLSNVDIVTGQTAPENVRRFIRDGVEGWFNPRTNKVTIVADNIHATTSMSKEERLSWVTWHELGHLGVNVRYRAEYQGIMEKARKHSVVNAMTQAIMEDRQRFVDSNGNYADPAATNKNIATEEALVELLAAHETGNFDELRQRYGVKINTLHEKNFKAWFKIIADRVRQLMNRLFNRPFNEMTDHDLVRLLGGIKEGINGKPTPPNGGKRFSLNESVDSDFAKAVDRAVQGKEVSGYVNVGKTPTVLKMLGLPDVKVTIHGSTFKKVIAGKHRITAEMFKQLPREINNPVAVMKSQTIENGYVVLTELNEYRNGKNNPVIAALHFKQDKNGVELINIASAYGKESLSSLQKMLDKSLLYWNNKKGTDFVNTFGLQLPAYVLKNQSPKGYPFANRAGLQLPSVVVSSDNLSALNIKTEDDLKQYLPEVKFSTAIAPLENAFDKIGLGSKKSAIEQSIDNFKQTKSRSFAEWKTLASEWGRKANTAIFDSLAPIKYWEDKAGVTDHTKSGYTAARLAAGSGSIAEASMLHGLPEWKDGIIQRKAGTTKNDALLGIMESLGNDMNDFLAWVAGNRAEKLMAEGREHNLTVEEITALKSLNKGKEQKFEQARKKLMAWNKSLLDLAEQAGLFTKEDRAKWEDPDWYIPFYRETEDGDVLAPFKNKGLANQNAGIKRLKGSDKATADLLSNIITNATKLIDASVKNDALTKAVVNLADTDVITVIDNSNLMDYRKLMRNKQGKGGNDGGLAVVKIKGQDYLIDIHDKALFNAITSVDQKPLDYPGRKIFAGAKRVLTATVTSMPDFIVRNFLRDLVQAATTDRNHMRLGIDSLKGLKEAYSKGGVSVDLMFSGASFGHGYLDAGDPKQAAENIRKHLRKKGYSKSDIDGYMKTVVWSKDQFTNLLDKYQHLNSAVENANRIAVYEAALRNGKSKAQAALEAKDLMDFSMKGNARIIRYAADVLPFFNARLQGLSQLGRSFKDNPKTFAKRGAMIALTSVGLALANMGNDRYEKLPDEEKDNYWHIFLGDQHLRIPKPFELGVVFGTMPERLLRTTLGEDSTGKLSDRISAAVINTLSLNPMPQVIKPIFELYMNKDMFTGREIESLSDKRFIASARYDYNTSLTARELGQITGNFGISPKQIDHLARGYFGTLGMYVLGMSDYLLRQTGDYGAQPDKNMNEYPVFSALWGGNINVPRRYTSYMNDYYEYLNKVTEIVATINNYEKKRGMKQEAERLREENQGLLRNAPLLNKTQKEIKGIKGELDLIYQDRVMSAEQKRARIDRLLEKRNNLIKMVAERIQKEDY